MIKKYRTASAYRVLCALKCARQDSDSEDQGLGNGEATSGSRGYSRVLGMSNPPRAPLPVAHGINCSLRQRDLFFRPSSFHVNSHCLRPMQTGGSVRISSSHCDPRCLLRLPITTFSTTWQACRPIRRTGRCFFLSFGAQSVGGIELDADTLVLVNGT